MGETVTLKNEQAPSPRFRLTVPQGLPPFSEVMEQLTDLPEAAIQETEQRDQTTEQANTERESLREILDELYDEINQIMTEGGILSVNGGYYLPWKEIGKHITPQGMTQFEQLPIVTGTTFEIQIINRVLDERIYDPIRDKTALERKNPFRPIIIGPSLVSKLRPNRLPTTAIPKSSKLPLYELNSFLLLTTADEDSILTSKQMEWRKKQSPITRFIDSLEKRLVVMIQAKSLEPQIIDNKMALIRIIMMDIYNNTRDSNLLDTAQSD